MRLFPTVTTKITLLFIVFITSFTSVARAELPDLTATKDERSLSNSSYVVGQHWFREINGSDAVIDFPPAYDYLRNALSKILPQTNLYNKTIEMTLLNSKQTNAFVIPGNHLFIYSDILDLITNQDMLYGLLAHEVSHLDLHHYERQTQHSGEELKKNLLLVGAGIAAALAGADADASAALWVGGMANQVDSALTYSRRQEQEADRHGRQYLIEAGLNPEGMSELFSALLKASMNNHQLEFLSSHPLPETRIADALSIKPQKSILTSTSKNGEFDYFRATLLAYRATLEDQPNQYLQQELPDNTDAGLFAHSLLYYLDHFPQKAIALLEKIHHQNRFTQYLLAISYKANQEYKKALVVTQSVLDIAPNDLAFSLLYDELTLTKPVRQETSYLYENKQVWNAKMYYYQETGNIPLALNYKAKLEFSKGKDKQAENLLKRAQSDAAEEDKRVILETQNNFDKVKEAEKAADIKDD